MRFLRGLVVIGAFLLAGVTAQAQTGGLEGDVRDREGNILVGATVEIVRTDIKMRFEVKTDKKGHYLYAGLPAGRQTRYTLRLIYQGQSLWEIRDVNVPFGELRRMDINLQEEAKRAAEQMTPEQRQQLEELRKQQEQAKSVEEHFNLGTEYLKQGQFSQAVAEFQTAAQIDPKQHVVFANLGQAYAGLNQPEKAIEAYEQAITLKPDEPALYNNLGGLYARLGRIEDAQRAYQKAAELNPTQAEMYYYNMGVTFVNAGQHKAAIEPLRKTIEANPKNAPAYYWLGICLYSTAEYKIEEGQVKTLLPPGTVEAFEKYLELEPNGQYAEQARQNLQIIQTQVPAAVQRKKK